MRDRGPVASCGYGSSVARFDPRGLVETLAQHGIDYIVIGGIAVGAHGYQRATNDLDIVPGPDPENLRRLATALKELDARIEGFEPDEVEIWPDAEGLGAGGNFVLSTMKGRLDVMQLQGDRDLYEMLEPGAVEVDLGYATVRICALSDLIELKHAAGRLQDRVDVEELKKLSGEGESN